MMDETTRTHLANIYSPVRDLQNTAYYALMDATDQPVDWAYEAWDGLIDGLKHEDNHVRAIAGQLLNGLAKSDPEKRMLKDFPVLLAATKDERFVTARHILQSLWKVGVAGVEQQQVYVTGMAERFADCAAEKNCTLIRSDISESMRKVYDVVHDGSIREQALALIETEPDEKYRKKYAAVWKKP
jgi:hypothetical protein